MKVYIRFEGTDYEDETYKSIADSALFHMMQKWKFQTMWDLRSIEQEINEEGGIIILELPGRTHTKGFTRGLTDKINALILAADKS